MNGSRGESSMRKPISLTRVLRSSNRTVSQLLTSVRARAGLMDLVREYGSYRPRGGSTLTVTCYEQNLLGEKKTSLGGTANALIVPFRSGNPARASGMITCNSLIHNILRFSQNISRPVQPRSARRKTEEG